MCAYIYIYIFVVVIGPILEISYSEKQSNDTHNKLATWQHHSCNFLENKVDLKGKSWQKTEIPTVLRRELSVGHNGEMRMRLLQNSG